MSELTRPLIVALDFDDLDSAVDLVDKLDPATCRVKVGKQLFTRVGPAAVEQLVARKFDVFLDLKFHDIPNTVARAAAAAADLGVWMLNVHAGGGSAMMRAARASELAQGSHAQGSRTDSTSGKLEATASSMFRKLKASASSAARATKEAAQNVGQGAQSAASAVYVSTAAAASSTTAAANKRGTLTNIMATTAAQGAGWGFGTTVGHGAGAAVVRTIFPAPPRRR